MYGKCALAKGLTNNIGMGSSEFHVIRTIDSISNEYIFSLLNRGSVRKEAEKSMTGSSGHRRVPASYFANLQIPIPPLNKQQQLITEIKKLEKQISAAKIIIASAAEQKEAVMDQYLKA